MIKVQHPSNNHVFGAPKGWDQSQLPCDALPVTIGEISGQPCIISYWKPTPEELEIFNNGGLLALSILGEGMSPVMLYATKD